MGFMVGLLELLGLCVLTYLVIWLLDGCLLGVVGFVITCSV